MKAVDDGWGISSCERCRTVRLRLHRDLRTHGPLLANRLTNHSGNRSREYKKSFDVITHRGTGERSERERRDK